MIKVRLDRSYVKPLSHLSGNCILSHSPDSKKALPLQVVGKGSSAFQSRVQATFRNVTPAREGARVGIRPIAAS